ncbi:MAG TPA: hypothetical protein VJ696_11065 [Rhodanobacteraceae bacterium]|nr:hypothetical protein [Rhodanobacteraceae bacterium]
MLRRFLFAAGLLAASASPAFAAAQGGIVTMSATKTVTGVFRPNGAIRYTIVLTNSGTATQPDNGGPELIDSIPGGLHVTATAATSGTISFDGPMFWDGAVPAGGSVTITIDATIDPALVGSVFNQAIVFVDTTGNGSNDASINTDDPTTPAPNDATVFVSAPYPQLWASLQAGGLAVPGGQMFYDLRVGNLGGPHGDNPGDELVTVFPAGIELVSATATMGDLVVDVGTNTLRWNGALGTGEFVRIPIVTRVAANANGPYSTQGVVHYDADDNGTNETTLLTDDPLQPGENDPTVVNITPLPAAFRFNMYAYAEGDVFDRGGRIYFDIIATNIGGTDQPDNPGDEIFVTLPDVVTYESVYALYGTTAYDPATRRFSWNGALARNGFVGMTITGRLSSSAEGPYSAQATMAFDSNNDGTNDATIPSDEPRTSIPNDPAGFQIILAVPALGWPALVLSIVALAFVARGRLRRMV